VWSCFEEFIIINLMVQSEFNLDLQFRSYDFLIPYKYFCMHRWVGLRWWDSVSSMHVVTFCALCLRCWDRMCGVKKTTDEDGSRLHHECVRQVLFVIFSYREEICVLFVSLSFLLYIFFIILSMLYIYLFLYIL
jgi:hypothetical protein